MTINITGIKEYAEETSVEAGGLERKAESDSSIPVKRIMNRMSFGGHMEMYWKLLFGGNETSPHRVLPFRNADLNVFYADAKPLKGVWLGHSTLLLNIGGYTILTDPVFEKRVSIVGPKSFHKKTPLSADQLIHVDVVIISHDHYDHLNKFSVVKLAEKASVFIVPVGVGERLEEWGIQREKIVELGWWDEYTFGEDLTVVATPSQHFSGRGLFDRNKTLWASWVLKTPLHRIFFSGDSGYFSGFKKIGDKYGPFEVAYLECGAYNERWSNVHMFPEETVQAFLDLRGERLQPIHWATFNLSLHSWYEPIQRLVEAAGNKKVQLLTPLIGEVVDYRQPPSTMSWWLQAMGRDGVEKPDMQLSAGVR